MKKNKIPNIINVVHATLYLGMGGLESVIMDLCRKHNRNMFRLTVVCFNGCDPVYSKELKKIGISIIIIKRAGRYDFMFFVRLVQLFRRLKANIVHAHSGCVFNSVLCAKLALVPVVVVTEHGLPIYADGSPMPVGLKAGIENYLVGLCSSKIIAVSDEIEHNLLATYQHFTRKIFTIINGIDTDKFVDISDHSLVVKDWNIPKDSIIIGSVGRLVAIKNYKVLLRAFVILQLHIANLHLAFVGDGPEFDALREEVRTAGVGEKVTFLGVRHDIHKLLPFFDVFVLPSVTEGTSISLLEAQSCGVPAVVTDVGGNPKIIQNGVNGYTVPVDDVELLAGKIETLVNDTSLRQKFSHNARRLILEQYDVKVKVSQYEQLYVDLLSSE